MHENEIEVSAQIENIVGSIIIVDGITFVTDSVTVFLDHNRMPVTIADLSVGMWVEVKGEKTGPITAKALRIKLEGMEDLEIFGKITAVNADNIMLNGLTVFVNEKTVFLNQSDLPVTFSDLSVDQFVEVKLVKNPDSTLLALSIKIEDGMHFSKINGFVGVVNGSSIQLPSGNYVINSKTAVVDNNFNVISNSKLTAGQQVIVWALVNSSSNKTALQIQSKVNSTSGVNNSPGLVNKFVLQQNYPNPFNPSTIIKYQIPKAGLVNLKVYDLLGREIATLVNENKIEGNFEVVFDASKLASGIYIYQLKSNEFVSSKKMILLK